MGFPSFQNRSRKSKRNRQRFQRAGAWVTLQPLEPRLLLAATVSGVVWHDANGDGARDAGEPGLPGWTVYLDSDNDGVHDAAELSQVTGEAGQYSFTSLTTGTRRVRVVPQDAWEQRTPLTSTLINQELPFGSTGEFIFDATRNRVYTTDRGYVRRFDLDTWLPLEPILAGEYLQGGDITPDGRHLYLADIITTPGTGYIRRVDLDTGEVANVLITSGSITDLALGAQRGIVTKSSSNTMFAYEFDPVTQTMVETVTATGTVGGQVARSADRSVFLASTGGSSATTTAYAAATGAVLGTKSWSSLVSSIIGVNRDGSIIAAESGTGIHFYDTQFNFLQSLPDVTGGFVFHPTADVVFAIDPSRDLIAFDTNTFTELYRLDVGASMGNSAPFGDGTMAMSNDGAFLFVDTPSGLRMISASPQPQPGAFVVSLGADTIRDDVNIGLRLLSESEIGGTIWRDDDGDGQRDAGEPVLTGRTVFLDLDGNGTRGPSEPMQATGAGGDYRFTGLAPGAYSVVVEHAAGERASYPATFAGAAESYWLPVPEARDIVYDSFRNRYYVTTDTGHLATWDVATRTQLPTLTVGTSLRAADITPDSAFLYIAEDARLQTRAFLHKVDLDTGGVLDLPFVSSHTDGGVLDVAIAGGYAYLTMEQYGFRRMSLADDTADSLFSIGANTTLARDASRSRLLLNESASTFEPLKLLDPVTGQTTLAKNGFSQGATSDFSFDGTLIAMRKSGVAILNTAFETVDHFGEIDGGFAFDLSRNVLYALDATNNEVVAIDLSRRREVFRVDVGEDVQNSQILGKGMLVAGHGSVALITDTGVRTFILPAPSFAATVRVGAAEITSSNDMGIVMNGVSLTVETPATPEDGAAAMTFTFQRDGDTSLPLSVQFELAGLALLGDDYTLAGAAAPVGGLGTIVIPAGQSTATLTITPVADLIPESDESVELRIVPDVSYAVATPEPRTAIILDDDRATVSVTLAPASVTEDGADNLAYTFTRDKTAGELTAYFNVYGTVSFANDYTVAGAETFDGSAGRITFADGAATAQLIINPNADATSEVDEYINVLLASGNYHAGAPTQAMGTIASDDLPQITLSVDRVSLAENERFVRFTFTRSSAAGGEAIIHFAVGGTANYDDDYDVSGDETYTSTSGSVQFSSTGLNTSILIELLNESLAEPSETITLTLLPGFGYNVASPSSATTTILNDDPPKITLTGVNLTSAEDGTQTSTFRFTRDLAVGALTANFTVAGTASLASDYAHSGAATFTSASGAVFFPDGVSVAEVVISPTDDAVNEAPETVILTLTSGAGYVVGTSTTATATITNDDAPVVTVTVAPAAANEDGATNLVYTFTRTGFGVAGNSTTVHFSVGGSALAQLDYVATNADTFGPTLGSVTLTSANSSVTKTVTINPSPDVNGELNETVVLTVIPGAGYVPGAAAAATGTITNDDAALLTLSVAIAPGSIGENGGAAVGTVTRTGPTTSSLLVYLTSSDYTEATVPATVTIPAGAASQTFTVTGVDDHFTDGNQPVIIEARTTPPLTPITLDAGFGTNGLATTPVRMAIQPPFAAMAVQADGKIIVAAEDSDSSRWRVARLLPNGQPDTTFGTGGSVTTAFSGSRPVPHGIVIQPDGKIVVGGKISTSSAAALARYNADGTIDAAYGTNGIVNTASITGWVEDMAFASDGKLLLAIRANGAVRFRAARVGTTGLVENFYTYDTVLDSATSILPLGDGRFLIGGGDFVVRSNANGTLDSTFGVAGSRTIVFNATSTTVQKIAFDSDGSILAAARVRNGLANGDNFGLARLTFDGAIDTSFGVGGYVVTDVAGFDDIPSALFLQPNRQIFVAGRVETAEDRFEAGFVRYNPNGTIDTAFDGDGKYVKSAIPSTDEYLFAAQLQADGKIVSFHGWATDYRVMRLIADTLPAASPAITITDDEPVLTLSLTIDPASISENGGSATGTVTRTGSTLTALVVTLASSDTTEATVPSTVTIPAGASSATFAITAVNDAVVDGTQPVTITASHAPPAVGSDTAFGTGGLATTSLRMNIQPPRAAIAVQPDGKIIAAAEDAVANLWRITRLLPGGGIDTSFGTAGVVTTPFSPGFPVPHKVLVQPDGKIIVGGKITQGTGTTALARYNDDGSPDPTFGVNGVADTSAIGGWIEDMVLRSDGSLLLAIGINGSVTFRAARVSAAGVVEAVINHPAATFYATSILALSDGRFLLAGGDAVMMITAAGAIDTTFGVGGSRTIGFGGAIPSITEIEIDALGRIVVAASLWSGANDTQDFGVTRLLPGGAIDATFGTGGYTVTDFNGVDDFVTAMILQPDGRIILAGNTESADSQYDAALARYTVDGMPDPTFDGDGRFRKSVLPNVNEQLLDAALFPDGKLVALHGFALDFRVGRYHLNAGPPVPATANINVIDEGVNHPPTDIALAPAAVAENAPIGSFAGKLSTSDLNAGTHTYALVAGPGDDDNAAFTIFREQVVTNLVFDRETKSTYSIRVRSTDPGGLSIEKVLVITVTDVDEIAPTVTRVFLDSSNWTDAYRDHMQTAGIGSAFGFGMEPDAPLQTLPWRINRIAVQFSEHVDVQQSDFALLGVNVEDYAAALAAGTFSYDAAAFTAVWTLATPLAGDKLRLVVSGDLTDAAGNPLDGNMLETGGDGPDGFAHRFNLLPGDVDGSGGVNDDVTLVRNAQFESTATAAYSALLDVNGDGIIRIDDVILVRNMQSSGLPAGEPGFPQAPLAPLSEGPAAPAVMAAVAPVAIPAASSPRGDLATMASLFTFWTDRRNPVNPRAQVPAARALPQIPRASWTATTRHQLQDWRPEPRRAATTPLHPADAPPRPSHHH